MSHDRKLKEMFVLLRLLHLLKYKIILRKNMKIKKVIFISLPFIIKN